MSEQATDAFSLLPRRALFLHLLPLVAVVVVVIIFLLEERQLFSP
jgi:hypothetical protein